MGGHGTPGRIPDEIRRWVADLAASLGPSQQQADEYMSVPDDVLGPMVADLTATLGWVQEQGPGVRSPERLVLRTWGCLSRPSG